MKIQIAQKLPNSSSLVFFLKNKEKIKEHAFFKLLPKEDKDYLEAFIDKNGKDNFSGCVFLPSGPLRRRGSETSKKILIVSAKENKKFPLRKIIISARRIIQLARKEKIKNIAVNPKDFIQYTGYGIRDTVEIAELLATQFELANFEFNNYKTAPKEGWDFIKETQIYVDSTQIDPDKIKQALRNGKIIGEEINKARILSNTPGGDMTPARLAEAAMKSGRECGFKVKILKENEIKKLGMGGVIGVSKGSVERPRFIIMEYLHGGKGEKPVVLVGKGVTFDTGGLNLKPDNYIYEMHMDMSGGAAVIHAISALARLKVKKNIIGLVPAVENMPSGSSYHPGDLLKTMNGKTIEVLNTDAEGRVILADALEYSKKYNPQLVVDIATLTGAAIAALGQRASAIFSTDEKIQKEFIDSGEKTGDYLWPLPLWEEYEEEVKGTFGDFANIGKTRYGGAIAAAVFLWQFIKTANGLAARGLAKRDKKQRAISDKQIPWVHLDIAPRMTTIESDSLAKGAAGASIALLINFLRK